MTIMQIQIPDDLKEAFEKAFPGETIEQAVERLLRAEVARKPPATDVVKGSASRTDKDVEALMEKFRRIRENSPPTSDEEIWALRQEGRP